MILLVFVHGYNLEIRYLQPWTVAGEPLTLTSFTEYFLANGIFRFRIPMLFIISGFLYALHDTTSNKARVGKRVRTLLVPYFLWSAFGIAATYLLEMIPYTRAMIASSHVVQIDETRMLVHDYQWYEVLARWIFFPVSYQLWFIRVLLIYNLAYPVIRFLVLHPRWSYVYFTIVGLMWLGTANLILIEGEGLLFFSLGVWIQKRSYNISEMPTKWIGTWFFLFVVLAVIKTLLAFEAFSLPETLLFPSLTILHKVVIVAGLISCWYGLDRIVTFFMSRPWFVWASSFSFMIYALHVPFVAFGIDESIGWFGSPWLAFVSWPLVVIAVCIVTGFALRTLTPALYALLTGGRGLARKTSAVSVIPS